MTAGSLCFDRESQMTKRNISELDEAAASMRVRWDKMYNFASSFARDFYQHKQAFTADEFAPDENGNPWTCSRWMLAKMGLSEKATLRLIEALGEIASSEEKERNRERLAEIKREEAAAKAARKAEKAAAEAAREAARLAKMAAKPKLTLVPPDGESRPQPSPARRGHHKDEAKRKEAIRLLYAGMPRKQVGQMLGMSDDALDRLAGGLALAAEVLREQSY